MAVPRISFVAVLAFAMTALPFVAQAKSPTLALAPNSYGASIDQGIACVLMLVALLLTYIIHVADYA